MMMMMMVIQVIYKFEEGGNLQKKQINKKRKVYSSVGQKIGSPPPMHLGSKRVVVRLGDAHDDALLSRRKRVDCPLRGKCMKYSI